MLNHKNVQIYLRGQNLKLTFVIYSRVWVICWFCECIRSVETLSRNKGFSFFYFFIFVPKHFQYLFQCHWTLAFQISAACQHYSNNRCEVRANDQQEKTEHCIGNYSLTVRFVQGGRVFSLFLCISRETHWHTAVLNNHHYFHPNQMCCDSRAASYPSSVPVSLILKIAASTLR